MVFQLFCCLGARLAFSVGAVDRNLRFRIVSFPHHVPDFHERHIDGPHDFVSHEIFLPEHVYKQEIFPKSIFRFSSSRSIVLGIALTPLSRGLLLAAGLSLLELLYCTFETFFELVYPLLKTLREILPGLAARVPDFTELIGNGLPTITKLLGASFEALMRFPREVLRFPHHLVYLFAQVAEPLFHFYDVAFFFVHLYYLLRQLFIDR